MNKKHLPEAIKSTRITLKKHDLRIAELMFSFVDRDRTRLREFLPWVDSTVAVQDEIEYIEMTHRHWDEYKCNESSRLN